MSQTLRIGGGRPLVPFDPAFAAERLADLATAAEESGYARLAAFCREGEDRDRLAAVLDLSTHLASLAIRRPDWLDRLFDEEAGARIRAIVAELGELPGEETSEGRLMTRLRDAKAEASLLIALRDLFGAADPARTTADLSDIADAATGAALRFCLLDLQTRGKLALPDPARPEAGCGLFVLGMGKLGGRELNYSSDIDLIVLFDPDVPALVEREESVDLFSRLVRRMVRLLAERTGDGYVFRTDLRLRPDPGAMPLAIPVPTALVYYEGSGRNWERAAMIKARPVAGDRAAAAEFLGEMTPFVWRKYLDFATVAEIHAMKERIDAHRGIGAASVAGQNVKLGTGGIREVEFFAQTQQLIAGGRAPELRLRRTDETLAALAKGGWIDPAAQEELTEAYWFMRRAEHAVQMLADEQTHTLPEDAEGLERVARLANFPDAAAFGDALLRRLHLVERRFDSLFASEGGRDAGEGPSLEALFAAEDDGPAIEALAALGFRRPETSVRVVRAWPGGRYRALRSEAARLHLSRVLPSLMKAFGTAPDPDGALAAFDAFLAKLPSGVQFFSLIASNPRILDLLTLILTAAPRLAETIGQRPHVFDALLDPAFTRERATRALLKERLDAFLADSSGYEDALVRLRIFASEQRFLVGARLLSGIVEGEEAGSGYSDIADIVIAAALEQVEAAFAERHGRVEGGRIALVGMGRLGSREMTAGSDVDLMLLYEHAETAEESDGEKPLAPSTYYTRLTQRLIAALSSPMGEGVLYEVDFRLRPSGNKGPLATELDAFRRYQQSEAWTWERMALTRARIIAATPGFDEAVADTLRAVLADRSKIDLVRSDAAAMRGRLERDKPADGALDLKLRPGGLIDLEFIAQTALLTDGVPLDLAGRPTAEVLARFEAATGEAGLSEAMRTYTRVLQLARLGPGTAARMEALPPRLAQRIAAALDLPDPDRVEPMLGDTAKRVREVFTRLLGALEA